MEDLFMFLFCFTISFQALFTCTTATDTLSVNQTIRDGQTIVSPQQNFELGFFTPGNNSQNRYLGIWYKRLATGTIAWVANRETPIRNKTGELTLDANGVLVLRDSAIDRIVWSSDSLRTAKNPMAQLLDNGNFRVIDREEGVENYTWQSFDHPGNTYLPDMKFGRNLETGVVTNFTSWKSDDDPSPGKFMVYMDFGGLPQIVEKNGDEMIYRLGSWNGLAYTGSPSYAPNPVYTYEHVTNEKEIYQKFHLVNMSVLSRLTLVPGGDMGRFNWINPTQGWFLLAAPTQDNCIRYALCGAYGMCDNELSPPCGCLKGFTSKRPDQWDLGDWSGGCQREIPLDCGVGEGFRKYSFVKLPDTRQSWFDRNMTLEQCEAKCKRECNCTAYTVLDIKYNTGCLLWYHELIDIRIFPNNGQELYIRMAAAELAKDKKVSKSKIKAPIIIVVVIAGLLILLGLCVLIVRKRMTKVQGRKDPIEETDIVDLPLFNLSKLLVATNNFSTDNKLGEGGFGPVYKGVLADGREIAVKRLSTRSLQGAEEFKNEVILISKLQHRNLVKIIGYCVDGEEYMLVYEYMPNKGLDLFLFQETASKILNWTRRWHIINGIARGLLYLHQDSRLRIIHRDLKAANILLDHDMNPKISDFGLARSFGGHETVKNTERVVGTYGYMSPEYAGDGIFSVKSDVFSFGVLVLEIVSGKKNRGYSHEEHSHNLLGHAWTLYKEGKNLELADTSLIDSEDISEVLRSIHVGLLCVQNNPDDRPNMSMVVMMLNGDGQLLEPKAPGFYTEDEKFGPESSTSIKTQNSTNEVTITLTIPR